LIKDIFAAFLIRFKTGLKKIREKEKPHDDEEYKELDKDDKPQAPANGHASETLIIEAEDPYENIFWHLVDGLS